MTVPDSADIAIVGGGIVGCMTALAVARRGVRVALFERGALGAEQSCRAWGFVRQQGRHPAELPLAAEAIGLWAEMTRRHGEAATGYCRGGILTPAETEADAGRVEAAYADARELGLPTRMLSQKDIAACVPELAGPWRAGLLTDGDGYAEPAAAMRTIAQSVRDAGVLVCEGTPVQRIELTGGRISGVATRAGRCRAPVVVVAGGIGAAALCRALGLRLPVQVVRSSVGRTRPAMPFTRIAVWGPRVAYRPLPDGSFVIGNGYRGAGVDYDLTPESLRHLRQFLPAYRRNWRQLRLSLGKEFLVRTACGGRAAPLPEPPVNRRKVAGNVAAFQAMFPHLGPVPLEAAWAGRIDMTPDLIPIIDRPEALPGLFVAAGFSGHGFAIAPSVGRQIGHWVMDGRPSLDLAAFSLARFAAGPAQRSAHSL